ncbi:MAG: penicillin-binding protein [Myxococcales bacterium]|nr:penicillin-binding protein [Myxococcales bacterium]
MARLPRGRRFWITVRVSFIAIVLLAGGVAVGKGAWHLGVVRQDELTGIAREQYTRQLKLNARRGMILDRYGQELAVEVEVDSIFADPREVVAPDAAARALAPILERDAAELSERLTMPKRFVWLKRRVPPEVAQAVKALKLPGIHLQKESKRFYPNRELAAHVIGYSGIDSQGLEGIEKRFDAQLKGNAHASAGLSDAAGNIVFSNETFGDGRAIGDNISLTIDRYLQYLVEQELAATCRLFEARAGHIVVNDPNTGEVLALANWPTFNPNDIRTSSQESRRNRALLDVFEPGSTFKVFTLAAGLNSGRVAPDEKFYCEEGRMEIYDAAIHDDHRDGWLDPTGCLARSSNICFAKMAMKIGSERLYHYLKRFGFGERTHLQMPFEMRGIMMHHSKWREFLTATIAFGQGIGVTGIQMSSALGAIANNGNLMKPYIVKEIVNSQGEVQLRTSPQVLRRVVSRRTARQVTDLMTAVTEEGGTGVGGAIDGYLVAGKTGTAQKSKGALGYRDKHNFVSSFFGFVPAENPKLAISVVIEEPVLNYYGGTVAAPAFARIGTKALRHMGIEPSRPGKPTVAAAKSRDAAKGKPEAATASRAPIQVKDEAASNAEAAAGPVPEDHVRIPSLLGLSMGQALKKLSAVELRPMMAGTGVAVEQVPAPGEWVPKGEYVQVNFQPMREQEASGP